VLACVRWLVRFDVLEHVPLSGRIAYEELASKAEVPIAQLRSIVRMAGTSGFLMEPERGFVGHTAVSSLLAKDSSFMDWARWLVDYSVPTALKAAEATEKWGETSAKDETAWSLARGKQLPFFDSLREEPGMTRMFSGYMRNVGSTDSVSFRHLSAGYDWSSLGANSTVVDVGGSRGHGSLALAKEFRHPQFIVQDLPETIVGVEETLVNEEPDIASRLKFMPHNFFEPQPITNADVYLLRMIIHDWPDQDALKILCQLKDALKKPGARVVIMDTVLPKSGTIPILEERKLRVRDLTMIQAFNAKERELEDWQSLVEKAGLEIMSVRHPAGSVMSLLEVGLPQKLPLGNGSLSAEDGNLTDARSNDNVKDPLTGPVAQASKVNGQSGHSSNAPILVVGAGIGGLCLAQALKKSGLDFLVFERDPALDHRPQGYRLKIEAEGQQALQKSLPAEVYKAFEASCAISNTGQTDYNPVNGQISKSRAGSGLAGDAGLKASATVDRSVFRKVLMTGIEDKIRFGKEVDTYTTGDSDAEVTLKFKDGSHVEGRFLVGADGVHSNVRKTMLPEASFVDTGAMCIYGKTPMTDELLEQFPEKGLRWMTCCVDKAPSIQSILIGNSPLTLLAEPIRFPAKSRQQLELPDDYVYWVVIGKKELFFADSKEAAAGLSPKEAARLTLDLTQEWHPSIRSLVQLQDVKQCSPMQVVSALPKLAPWEPSRYVTLVSPPWSSTAKNSSEVSILTQSQLGDSIHVMSPCGGVGANTALADAAELAEVLTGGANSTISAEGVGSYEESMRARAFKSVMRSYAGSRKMFDQRPFEECPAVQV
jgi:2-polyprenyl-6-methoxyphenol hydroxylase-like FAD-dependent oxidoreductase